MTARGEVVQQVATAYLHAIAAASEIDNAGALERQDQVQLDNVRAAHLAGTAANLDELRARVQLQTQQQALINAENIFEKAKIALNRQIGLAPEQKIQLTEAAPYSELAAITIENAKQQAYNNRQDYQSMKQQIVAAELERKAVKHERMPTLSFTGNYGVIGIAGGNYHDMFTAMGTLSIPVFQEATFRGNRDVAVAQVDELTAQMADLRSRIDQQLRDSLLDLQTAAELVRVAHSNVDLATKTLEQTTDRFQAGIDDNLPVVQAQSTLAQAQTQYVNSVFQFNQAKLGLARNLGIVDTQYKTYIQGGK
jgi:outer membrane protein TolC